MKIVILVSFIIVILVSFIVAIFLIELCFKLHENQTLWNMLRITLADELLWLATRIAPKTKEGHIILRGVMKIYSDLYVKKNL